MPELPYQLERTVVIKARPETVFRFFTDSARWAGWWGAGSTIDATPGGKMYIRHPNGVETLGEVLEVTHPERIVFTYGFAGGKPIPPGASLVTIRLDPELESALDSRSRMSPTARARDVIHVVVWCTPLTRGGNAACKARSSVGTIDA